MSRWFTMPSYAMMDCRPWRDRDASDPRDPYMEPWREIDLDRGSLYNHWRGWRWSVVGGEDSPDRIAEANDTTNSPATSTWLPDHYRPLLTHDDNMHPQEWLGSSVAADDMPRGHADVIVARFEDVPGWWRDARMTMSVTTTGSVDVGDRVWLMLPDTPRRMCLVERVVGNLVTLGEPER